MRTLHFYISTDSISTKIEANTVDITKDVEKRDTLQQINSNKTTKDTAQETSPILTKDTVVRRLDTTKKEMTISSHSTSTVPTDSIPFYDTTTSQLDSTTLTLHEKSPFQEEVIHSTNIPIIPIDHIGKDTVHANTDTLSVASTRPIGGEVHPINRQSSSWITGITLFLFLLFIFQLQTLKNSLYDTLKSYFNFKEQKQTLFELRKTHSPIFPYSTIVLTTLLMGFGLYLTMSPTSQIETSFSFNKFLLLTGVVGTIFLFKLLIMQYLSAIYFDKSTKLTYLNSYYELLNIISIIFYPIFVFYLFASEKYTLHNKHEIFYLVILIYLFMVIFKLLHIFYSKIIDLFYIFLYFCTLEILPVIILLSSVRYII